MNNFSNGACLARGKETCATSSLGFRDERLLILEQILEHYNELDFKITRDISISVSMVLKSQIRSRDFSIFDMYTACVIAIKNVNVQSYGIT